VSELKATVETTLRRTVPILGTMGMEVVAAEQGRVRTRLPFVPGNGNHIGTVYAGVLYSFLEATGGALVMVSLDVLRFVPVIVQGSIRYLRPVTGPIECDVSLATAERDAVHASLEADHKYRWMLLAQASAEDGRVACEADLVYRFRIVGG
jgi:thioesterase domain-containing protein